jgi:quinol-cytochrome oxidoreductase complex cytochrome b subunit
MDAPRRDPASDDVDRACIAPDGVREHDLQAEWKGQKTIRFFPDHFVSEGTAMVLLLCLISFLCIFAPAALQIRADSSVVPAASKPDWYLLFLYKYVQLVPPALGAVTPPLLILLLGAWPFIDRNPSRAPRTRVLALVFGVVVVLAVLALTVLAWVE